MKTKHEVLLVVLFFGIIIAIGGKVLYDNALQLAETIVEMRQENDDLRARNEKLMKERDQSKQEAEELSSQLMELEQRNTELDQRIKNREKEIQNLKTSRSVQRTPVAVRQASRGKILNVTATAYTKHCAGCSGITAYGIDIRNQTPKIIAVDPKVIPLGTMVEVIVGGQSWGMYMAGDTGGAIKGNKIDILMDSREKAKVFGVQGVQVKY